jgi:hypothetical protein
MAQEFWENLTADAVLKEIFDQLRHEPYLERMTNRLYDRARSQWNASQGQDGAAFVSAFILENPDLFDELKTSIGQIFQSTGQFAVHRNPDLQDM